MKKSKKRLEVTTEKKSYSSLDTVDICVCVAGCWKYKRVCVNGNDARVNCLLFCLCFCCVWNVSSVL